jgi:hypothetical protein
MPIGESRIPGAEFITSGIDCGIELVAGPEAERKLNGSWDAGIGRSDIAQAQLYAAAITVSPDAARFYIDLFHAEARFLVDRYWHAVVAVADGLLDRQTLTGEEVDSIIFEAEVAHAVADAKASRAAWRETVKRAEQFERIGVQL